MATKPTIADARWGETAGGSPGGNQTAPSSGLRDSGFALAAAMVSSYFNLLFRQFYLWCKYLSEGDLVGNHSIDGDLDVDGDASYTGSLIGGPATIGNLSAVDGDFSGDVTADGVYRHGTITSPIANGGAGYGSSGLSVSVDGDLIVGVGHTAFYDVLLPVGRRLQNVRIRVEDASTVTVTARLRRKVLAGTMTTLATATSNAGGSAQTLAMNGVNETLAALTSYRVEVTTDSASADCFVLRLEMDWDYLP